MVVVLAVIEVMKEEAAKRSAGRDASAAKAKADDNDKRKWMSTAQLWVDSRATDPVVRFHPSFSFLFWFDFVSWIFVC